MIEEIILLDSKAVRKGKKKANGIKVGLRVPDASDSSILLYNLEHNNFVRLPLVIKNEDGKLMLHILAKSKTTQDMEDHKDDPTYPPPTYSIEIELDGNNNDNKEIKTNGNK